MEIGVVRLLCSSVILEDEVIDKTTQVGYLRDYSWATN